MINAVFANIVPPAIPYDVTLYLGPVGGVAFGAAFLEAFGSTPAVILSAGGGTADAPAATAKDQYVGYVTGEGWYAPDGGAPAQRTGHVQASIGFMATEDWTATGLGTCTQLWGTPTGSTTLQNILNVMGDGTIETLEAGGTMVEVFTGTIPAGASLTVVNGFIVGHS